MSVLNIFKKPNWKNKDATIRAKAVSQETSPELIEQLAHISQNDVSEQVRLAALKRLQDFQLILNIAENDARKTLKSAAYKMLQEWLKNHQDDRQLSIIQQITEQTSLEIIAQQASDKKIRQYCIEKIEKQGLLGDLLLTEIDPHLRQIIVAKINKPATLKRIAKLIKNKDKSSFKAIQAKLELSTDKAQLHHHKGLELCEAMEKLIHNSNNASPADVAKLHAKWLELKQLDDLTDLNQRFEGAYTTANLTLNPQLRDEFLAQQKQQRINSTLQQLESTVAHSQNASFEQLQTHISKYSQLAGSDLTDASTEQRQQFENHLAALKTLRDGQPQPQEIPEKLLHLLDQLDATLKQKYNQPQQIKQFRAMWQAMWDTDIQQTKENPALQTLKAHFDKNMLALAEKVENTANLREQAAKNAVNAIASVQKLIQDGHLAEAKIGINKIAENKKIAGTHALIQQHKFEFDTLWNELKELRQWQTWSHDKIRIRLIQELEQLLGTGTHPDALLKKMQESNQLWKDMEEHEKLAGDKYGVRNQELYSKFRAVQQALFEPAQKYFEQRSEIWDTHLQQLETKIETLHAVDLTTTDEKELAKILKNAIKQLDNLDKIPPKMRGKCAAKIRAGINRINKHLKDSYKIVQQRKQNLIEQAQQLASDEDLSAAIEQAKILQQEWKTAGFLPQAQETKLFKAFRKANDAVFNRIAQQREELYQEKQQLFNQAQELIKTYQTTIAQETTAQGIHTHIEKFRQTFNDLKTDNKSLQAQANQLIHSAQTHVASLANAAIINALKNLEKMANICTDLEQHNIQLEQANELISHIPPLENPKWSIKIEQRLQHNNPSNDEFITQANEILIAGEYLCGLASPDAYKQQRLNFQVNKLAKRMSGEPALDTTATAIQLLSSWFMLSGVDKTFIQENHKRIKKVIKSLFDLLKS